MIQNRHEYERRVNRAIDFIERNPSAELSLDRMAKIANFSPYHFHRVFKSITTETVFDFCQRVRIEKAARSLLTSADRSVLQTAQACGFSSAAAFARAFKARFGMSATEWRSGGYRRWRQLQKNSQSGRAISKASKAPTSNIRDNGRAIKSNDTQVTVRNLPSYRVAYMRYVGPYGSKGILQLWEKLRMWRSAHKAKLGESFSLGIAYNNPHITAENTCRYDACVAVPTDFLADRRVNTINTASGRYAIFQFEGSLDELTVAWDRAFDSWLPESGYEPDDMPCIERYLSDGLDPKTGRFSAELCLPVRLL
jgi:AraC family transcriptional regulator